jgi:hypothetical protein
MCEKRLAPDGSTCMQALCAARRGGHWRLAEAIFLATFGHAQPFATLLHAAKPLHDVPQDVAALMARLQCSIRLMNTRDWPSRQDGSACDDPVIMPCCNALLRAYVQAEPPQLQRAAALLSALIQCAHALPHASTSFISHTACRSELSAASWRVATMYKCQASSISTC